MDRLNPAPDRGPGSTPAATRSGPPTEIRLVAENLTAAYDGPPVLHGVSFALGAGEVIAVIGPNGAGKSTLLRCLSGYLPPQQGEVRLDGRPLAGVPIPERARRIGFVPAQMEMVFPLTVEELAAAGRAPHAGPWRALGARDRAAIDHALRAMDLADRRGTLVRDLSAGQRQRALLAVALAQEAEILLLDEPTAHLDVHHAWDLFERLRTFSARPGCCTAVALHDLNLAAAFCTSVILLDGGRVVASGAPADILTAARLQQVYRHPMRVVPHADGVAFCPVRPPPPDRPG